MRWRWGLLLSIASPVFGQAADKPALEWIRSGEPLKQAWAAHWIVEQHNEALIPELRKVLADPLAVAPAGEKGVTDAEAARLAILDAMVQMHQTVPLADLDPYIEKFPTLVLILAMRSEEDNGALLLRLLNRPHSYGAFIAIGNVLTPRRDSSFALHALQEFSVCDHIMVFDAGQDQNIGGGISGDRFGERPAERKDWPEVGAYWVGPMQSTKTMPRGGELLAEARGKVYFTRSVNKLYVDHGFEDFGTSLGQTIPERAEEFLADYLDTQPEKLPIRAVETIKLTWAGNDDFRARMKQFFATQRMQYALLVASLVVRQILPSERSAPALQVGLWIDDERQMNRSELPDLRDLMPTRD